MRENLNYMLQIATTTFSFWGLYVWVMKIIFFYYTDIFWKKEKKMEDNNGR